MDTINEFSLKPTLYSGENSRKILLQKIKELGGEKVILFTDKGLIDAGVADQIKDLFKESSCPVILAGIFDGIEQDAKGSNINQGVKYVKECHADTLIALGGGSVLDTVKIIKWMLHKGYEDINEVLQDVIRESFPQAQPINIPHIAIPTTAGTGSEVSPIAVSYNEKSRIKTFIRNPYISPDIAILDPHLTTGLPPKITAFTGFDALTHAIEGFFAKGANPISDAFALHSAQLIIENLPDAVFYGSNLVSREKMLLASSMGMTAFTHGATEFPVHNLAHVFGAKFRIPHGLANAVILPSLMAAFPSLYLPKINQFSKAIGLVNSLEDPQETLDKVIQFLRDFRHQIGLPETFAEFNLQSIQLTNIIAEVHSDPSARFTIPDDVIIKVINEVSGVNVNHEPTFQG